jgi:hypothetical protein
MGGSPITEARRVPRALGNRAQGSYRSEARIGARRYQAGPSAAPPGRLRCLLDLHLGAERTKRAQKGSRIRMLDVQ